MTGIELANAYYDAFRKQTDFSEVPLADSLIFRGPSGTLEGPATFRAVLGGLAKQLKGFEIRHQLSEGPTVITVYDFDLGMPDGAIPMAEILRTENNEIHEIELLFDSARLGGGGK